MFRTVVFAAAGLALSAGGALADGPSVEFGRHMSIVGGCHDCHTVGYAENAGKIDDNIALKGNPVGYAGPWGTNFARNLRITVSTMSEDDWVAFAGSFQAGPPMPWFNVHEFTETEARSLYQYIKSLPGGLGDPAPTDQPPKG